MILRGFGSGAVISGEQGHNGILFRLEFDGEKFFLLEVWSGRGVGLELLEAQHEDAKLGGGFEQRSSELRLGVIRLGVEDEIIA